MTDSNNIRRRWISRFTGLVVLVAAQQLVAVPHAAAAGPQSLSISTSGTNGTVQQGASDCSDYATEAVWSASATLPAGTLTSEAALLSATQTVDTGASQAVWRDGTFALSNSRGTLVLDVPASNCAAPTLNVNGGFASGTSTWSVVGGSSTGGYAGASGSGTFTTTFGVAPTATAWTLALTGNVSVVQPAFSVTARAFWAAGNADFGRKRLTVEYTVTNTGTGYAYAARVADAAASSGATRLTGVPRSLGDLAPNASATTAIQYQLSPGKPCKLQAGGCSFGVSVSVGALDALDGAVSSTTPLTILAPSTPTGQTSAP